MLGILAAIAIAIVHGHCVQCDRPYRLGDMQFLSRSDGWATAFYVAVTNGHVSEYGVVVHTTDGGKRWTQVPDVETYQVEPTFWFLDAHTGWVYWPTASDPLDHFIRTRDGGRSWRNAHAPGYLSHFRFFTERLGVATIATSERAGFALTTNGGVDWEEQVMDIGTADAMQFLDRNVGWLAGTKTQNDESLPRWLPRVFYTSNGGRSWSSASMPDGVRGDLHDMYFADHTHGWLIVWNGGRGNINTLLKSIDGGKSWQVDSHPEFQRSDRQLDAVRFLSPRIGFVFVTDGDILSESDVGKSAAVLWTNDGGATWQQQPLPSSVQSCTTVENEIWCGSRIDLMKFRWR